MGKEEIARNEKFLLFPQCFLSFRTTFGLFYQIYNCRLQSLSDWESLTFVVWKRDNCSCMELESFLCMTRLTSDLTAFSCRLIFTCGVLSLLKRIFFPHRFIYLMKSYNYWNCQFEVRIMIINETIL